MNHFSNTSIPQANGLWRLGQLSLALLLIICSLVGNSVFAADTERQRFMSAWDAAKHGDHDRFEQISQSLNGYVLFPYLQYEDYRNRRSTIPADEMAAFLKAHQGWAFTGGLRSAWLKSLAKKRRWADLVANSDSVTDTVLKCQRARGQIILKQTDGLISEAQKLWTVGKSQPDECDPVFAWLVDIDGIPESLAWERIRLAINAGNRSLAIYLARYVSGEQRRTLEAWNNLSRGGYSRLERARSWPDDEISQMLTATSLQRLARKDATVAAKKFVLLDGHFSWGEARRFALLRDIALYSAVGLEAGTGERMAQVPVIYRDSQLLEWWARFLLSEKDWSSLIEVIEQMPDDTRNDERWRYWLAQAGIRSGQKKSGSTPLQELATQANYYGFLAADELGLGYNICPLQPDINSGDIELLAERDGFRRALELRKAELDNWANAEWSLATSRLPATELKTAAALANRESWHDRAIFALGNSGDLRFYEWRFPLLWEADITREAAANKVDPAWVYGTIRAESAMVEAARSSANALGLMQVTPATGKRVAVKHGITWRGSAQLKTAEGNLPIGTAYLGDLLQDYRHNPVLVSGSYNAGPNAVKRWLNSRPMGEAAIWIETLPDFETRDYIPRVLAFTTIYDWRMGGTVKRISERMPHIESGKISVKGNTEVLCLDAGDED
ncbi:MAG: transglycosylase SLT domain-containing protein [Xanthomonadales bacterium]|nr:transglycosylase SLT domain-containing protein [Xanthomonadales bacterium]